MSGQLHPVFGHLPLHTDISEPGAVFTRMGEQVCDISILHTNQAEIERSVKLAQAFAATPEMVCALRVVVRDINDTSDQGRAALAIAHAVLESIPADL